MKNVTGYRNPNFVAEQDFMYIIGKKKERASKETAEEEETKQEHDDEKNNQPSQSDNADEAGEESEIKPVLTMTQIEENLYNDPDFKKSYEKLKL